MGREPYHLATTAYRDCPAVQLDSNCQKNWLARHDDKTAMGPKQDQIDILDRFLDEEKRAERIAVSYNRAGILASDSRL